VIPKQTSTHLEHPENAKEELQNTRRAKRRMSLLLAIWELWEWGDLSQFEFLFNVVEYYDPLDVNINEIRHINLDLSEWAALYPRHMNSEAQSRGAPPSLPERDTQTLAREMHACLGYAIASRKRSMNPLDCEAYASQSTVGLAAIMILTPDRSTSLRQCVSSILTELGPILQHQFFDLKAPCEKLIKYLSHPPSRSEESSTEHDCEERDDAAMLAMICHRELKAQGILDNLAFNEVALILDAGAKFSIKEALLWLARLMLFYASPKLINSPLPQNLCARALDGRMQILDMISVLNSPSPSRRC
jgi:hypothetical protein